MKAFALAVLFGLTFSALGADSKDPAKSGPAWDPATVVDVIGTVAEIREVAKGSPIEGVNLTVKLKNETVNVYVAPVEFVKLMDVKFAKGDEVQVIGSKVKFEGSDLILARELRIGKLTFSVRDKDGGPFWKYFQKIPTGL